MPARALPFDPFLLAAFRGGLLRAAAPTIPAASVVGYDTLARTSELPGMHRSIVMYTSSQAVICFVATKHGKLLGINEGFCVRDLVVVDMEHCLATLTERGVLAPGDRMLGVT